MIADAGMTRVNLSLDLPNLAAQWMMGNLATLLGELNDKWPRCASKMTDEIALGLFLSKSLYNLDTAAVAEELRVQANEAMALGVREGRPDRVLHPPRSCVQRRVADLVRGARPVKFIKANTVSRYVMRGVLGGVRFVTGGGARPSQRTDRHREPQVPRLRVDGRAHDPRQHLRQPVGVDSRRHARWTSRRDAGHGRAPPRLAALRRRPLGRAAPPVAARRTKRLGRRCTRERLTSAWRAARSRRVASAPSGGVAPRRSVGVPPSAASVVR